MIEGARREAHTRRYHDTEGRTAIIDVDEHGSVYITEELLHTLLIGNGLTEDD